MTEQAAPNYSDPKYHAMTDAIAIELTGLSRRYGLQYVLKDIHLSIRTGKIVLLAGNNGSGKTTLLKVLATKLRPSQGNASVFGLDVVKKAHEVRKQVAYMSVLGGHYGSMTAFENLRLSASLYGHNRQEVSNAELEGKLAAVGLLKAKNKLVRLFSSGMKKRLAIARLLLSDADIWLLDEPYVALDEEGRKLVDDLLIEGKAQSKTILIATHDIAHASQFADSTLKIDNSSLKKLEPLEFGA